ncbi:MAG: DUF305 domain-containing protein, partial [Gemmatimonadota bacterium]
PVAEVASPALSATTSPGAAADTARRPTAADVAFMQGMIGHHAQALVMTALVPERSSRSDLGLLAERITASQRDEITQMQFWLRDRGIDAPDPASAHAHHDAGHAALMPGMLTPEEIAQLGAARGNAFDRLFLEFMIKHHEGALRMVDDLRRSPGALQEPQLFDFASDVDADQRAEIARMRRLLASLPNG